MHPEKKTRDRTGLFVFLFLLGVYLVTFGGHFYSGDGIEMARTAESLVLRGELALPEVAGERHWGYPGRGGKYYGPYPLGQSLAEAPFIAVSAFVTDPLPIEERLKERLRHAATVGSNAFITAGIGFVLFLFGRRLGYDRWVASALALAFGLGTMAWVYARQDFADPLTGLTLLGSIYLLRRWGDTGEPGDIFKSGLLLGFSLFTKYQMVIYCPIVWIYLLLIRSERKERGLRSLVLDTIRLAGPVILFGLGDLAVNYWKFGALLSTGYEQEASPWAGWLHLPAGLYGFLLSPGKSIFLYNPLLILWPFAIRSFHGSHRSESLVTLAATGTTLVFFSPLYWWHGDWAWGPRYLYPLIPLLVLSLGPLFQAARSAVTLRRVVVVLLIAAFGMNFLGMTVNFFFYIRALTSAGRVHDDWNFIPGLSPVAFHYHVVRSGVNEILFGEPLEYRYRAWTDGTFTDTTISLADGEYSREGKIPDYFFFKAYDTTVERYGLGLIGLLLIGLTLVTGRRLLRELRA